MTITIACGQFAPVSGDVAGNAGRMCAQAREAARRGASLLVLPELCLCGYSSPEEARVRAVEVRSAEIRGMEQCARAVGIAICFGFAERADDGRLYNSMAFVDRGGSLRAVYRKVHLWKTESAWATPGTGFPSFESGSLRLGMWICYDTRFPEAARRLALSGATLGLVGTAWFGPAEEWELAMRARALDNGIYTAGASMLGVFGKDPFRGVSLIVDPHGRVIARAREDRDEVICAVYDDGAVEAFRARVPLLEDRRPGAYA
jgi:predicted amidohydrolase